MTESENVAPEAAGPVEGPETVEAVTVSPETTTGRSAPSDADAQLPGESGKRSGQETATPGEAAAQAQRRGSGASRADEYVTRVRHWLARNKSYPERARRQNLEGVVRIRFAVDREGRVLDYRIVSSSGHALLDQEVEAMIERAQPLPSMPEKLRRTRMELVVPIHFSLHRR